MLKINQLKLTDRGRFVRFLDNYGQEELGRIKNWSKKHVFVVFNCDQKWDLYQDFTAVAVLPDQLSFIE